MAPGIAEDKPALCCKQCMCKVLLDKMHPTKETRSGWQAGASNGVGTASGQKAPHKMITGWTVLTAIIYQTRLGECLHHAHSVEGTPSPPCGGGGGHEVKSPPGGGGIAQHNGCTKTAAVPI